MKPCLPLAYYRQIADSIPKAALYTDEDETSRTFSAPPKDMINPNKQFSVPRIIRGDMKFDIKVIQEKEMKL